MISTPTKISYDVVLQVFKTYDPEEHEWKIRDFHFVLEGLLKAAGAEFWNNEERVKRIFTAKFGTIKGEDAYILAKNLVEIEHHLDLLIEYTNSKDLDNINETFEIIEYNLDEIGGRIAPVACNTYYSALNRTVNKLVAEAEELWFE